jgi:hypothetical protein
LLFYYLLLKLKNLSDFDYIVSLKMTKRRGNDCVVPANASLAASPTLPRPANAKAEKLDESSTSALPLDASRLEEFEEIQLTEKRVHDQTRLSY